MTDTHVIQLGISFSSQFQLFSLVGYLWNRTGGCSILSVSQYIFLCPREVKSLTPASNNRREDWRTGLLTVHFTLFPWFHFFLPVPVFLILPSDEVGASKTHLATLSFIPKSQHVTVFAICSLILYKVVLVVVFIASAVCWQHWQVGLSFLVEE